MSRRCDILDLDRTRRTSLLRCPDHCLYTLATLAQDLVVSLCDMLSFHVHRRVKPRRTVGCFHQPYNTHRTEFILWSNNRMRARERALPYQPSIQFIFPLSISNLCVYGDRYKYITSRWCVQWWYPITAVDSVCIWNMECNTLVYGLWCLWLFFFV